MAIIRTWKDLKVWQRAHQLVLLVYRLTKQFPAEEKFGLSSQLRRAAVSVASNIVEGFRRRTINDSLNFYNMADSSLEEVKYQLLLAYDLRYLTADEFSQTEQITNEVGKMLYGWSTSQRNNTSPA